MRAQEKQKASHLVILICYTIFTIVLTAESLLLGWQPVIVLLLLAALTAAWVIHITDTFTEHIRLWVYFVMSMLAYVFYGIHETSMYDLAPVMIFVIIVYSITEKELFITLCVSVYFLILLSVALFVLVFCHNTTTKPQWQMNIFYSRSRFVYVINNPSSNLFSTIPSTTCDLNLRRADVGIKRGINRTPYQFALFFQVKVLEKHGGRKDLS